MSPCPTAKHIRQLADGLMAGPVRDSCRAHLATCASCREQFEELRRQGTAVTSGDPHSLLQDDGPQAPPSQTLGPKAPRVENTSLHALHRASQQDPLSLEPPD